MGHPPGTIQTIQMDKEPSSIVNMVFSRRTICIVPVFVGALLLLSAAHMLGQQGSQDSSQQTPPANGQSQAPPPSSGKNQTSGQGQASGQSQSGQSQSGQKQGSQKSTSQKSSSQSSSGQKSDHQAKPTSGAGSAAAPVPNSSAPNSPAVSNPFPMAQSKAAEKADEQKSQDNGKTSASQANPFPEAQSKAAAKGDGSGNSESPKAGSSSSSGSSSGGYSSSDAHLPAPDVGQGKLGRHEKMDSFTRDQTLDGRVEDDLNVADLYSKNGNYRGASLRYQDALKYDPQNDTAQYGLAETMCKENLTSQAMDHFKSYVANHPQGQYVKKAEKMLADPKKCQHNR